MILNARCFLEARLWFRAAQVRENVSVISVNENPPAEKQNERLSRRCFWDQVLLLSFNPSKGTGSVDVVNN